MNYKMTIVYLRKKKVLADDNWLASYLMLTWDHFKYKVQTFLFNQPVRINLMEKQRICCSEQNNYSNCPLPPGGVLPHLVGGLPLTLCLRKKIEKKSENMHMFLLNNTFTVKLVFSSVHQQFKLHSENFYITLVNTVHSYNNNTKNCFFLWLFLEQTVVLYPKVILMKPTQYTVHTIHTIIIHVRRVDM